MDITTRIHQAVVGHLWARDEIPQLLKECQREIERLRTQTVSTELALDQRVERAINAIDAIATDYRYSLPLRDDALLKVLSAIPRRSGEAAE